MASQRGTVILDPYNSEPIRQRVNVTGCINAKVHHDFFTKRFCRTPGIVNALVNTFVSKLILACDAEGIPSHYEPDNESRLATVLARLNFDSKPVVKPTPGSRRKRTAASSPVAPAQPNGEGHELGSASSVRLPD